MKEPHWIQIDFPYFPDYVEELFTAGKKKDGTWQIYRLSRESKETIKKSCELLERYDDVKITHWMPIVAPDTPED